METHNFTVTEAEQNIRLDIFLHGKLPNISRSYLKMLIADENILLDDKKTKPAQKLKTNQTIEVNIPAPKQASIEPEDIPLDILLEDDDIIVINKPAGMVVHPAAGNYEGTVVNALLYHTKNLSGIGGVIRPGIVHRLDKDTSGCLIIAKNDTAHKELSSQFEHRSIMKKYVALAQGTFEQPQNTITTKIRRHPSQRKKMQAHPRIGKEAISEYKVIEKYNKLSLVEVIIKTGRTHQIRVHLSYIGHPIVGDTTYGGNKIYQNRTYDRVMLHAHMMTFTHPTTNEEITVTAPIPFDVHS